jgi:hypothetical protein
MIFYGTSASRLKDGRLSNVSCPNCEEQTSFNYSVFGKYAYIYWIPLFPLGKTNVLECNNCKQTYKLKELPEQIKHKFQLEKHKGIPLKHFSGLAIIFAIVAWFKYSSAQDDALDKDYITEPQVGDLYSAKGSAFNSFTTMKVSKVTADSVYVFYNDYLTDKKSGISEIDVERNYNFTNREGFTRQELIRMHETRDIFEIDRD